LIMENCQDLREKVNGYLIIEIPLNSHDTSCLFFQAL
jgi:hypothetical protein